eukprot:6170276-Prorocentrum_lima.AAC.1
MACTDAGLTTCAPTAWQHLGMEVEADDDIDIAVKRLDHRLLSTTLCTNMVCKSAREKKTPAFCREA